ncbi:MAG: ATP-binding protein [Acidimicrobiales bacterium]
MSAARTPTGTAHVEWDVEPDTTMVAETRRRTGELLSEWGCQAMVTDAQLVVSELVNNAILHAGSSCRVSLALSDQRLTIEVTDDDPSPPEPQPFDPHREGGRGLLIVSTLATRWGIEPVGTGKTVWAELAA